MTVQTFRLPVMAQLLRETSCVNIWDGYSGNERAKRFLGCASEIRRRGWAVDPSVDRTLNALNSSVAKDVMKSGTVDDGTAILARCTTTTPAGSPRALMFDEVSKTDGAQL